ncbi:MAG: hypothetical protein CVU39_23320 [Chloroflexi bacterium HGW-Chloroflexi-10]|nr:MAG: hypothetical protein CVU39_23320 [Chloroflexi bacterium HGW-Chloroflexi-10]
MQKKNQIFTVFIIIGLAAFLWNSVLAAPANQLESPYFSYFPVITQAEPPYISYFPIIAQAEPTPTQPPAVPPAYYTTSWYMTPLSVTTTYAKGCAAGNQTKTVAGAQDGLIILDYGQPWSDGIQYGTLLLTEPTYNLNSTNDIMVYTRNFINGYMACSDGISTIDIGIGTTNYVYYIGEENCYGQNWFCTTGRAYNHGKAWAQMVLSMHNWVAQQGYAAQVTVSGATDIELSWNYATVSRAWVDGFDDFDNDTVIFYNYGTCDGCPTRLAPKDDPDLVWDWTMSDVHYTAWRAGAVWPIPEIYDNEGILARQWAYLSKWGVSRGYTRMYFLSALTQMQACIGNSDPHCSYLDNTPVQAWHQLHDELNYWPETAQYTIPWMTDIDWP